MSTNARGRARRRQLLDAALTTFGERGFRGASLASIADQVGISEPGLLHHFKSKDQLLIALLEEHETGHERRMEAVLESAGGALATALVDLATQHERDPGFIRLLSVLAAESVDPEHPAHDWFAARYRATRGHFA